MNSYKIIIGYYNKICSVCNKEIPIIFTQAGLLKINENENQLLYNGHFKCIKKSMIRLIYKY
ncbi:hypothetical protein [Spiroplasma citri]|uniref:hypothetical protein n=2 Tax=Spiroplasma citri TaxID=2133 RepID=UPI00247B0C98|nr:hypothetical protein [Spiroplasma citri]